MTAKRTSPKKQPTRKAKKPGRPTASRRKPADRKATGKTATKARKTSSGGGQFIEIVNWRKAQPKMRGPNNPWFKVYTSLLDYEPFAGMDDAARVLLFGIWMLAARTGMHIFPADPAWLKRKLPFLNGTPNLKPLLEARDEFGNARPFIRHCKAGEQVADPEEAIADKSDNVGIYNVHNSEKSADRVEKREEIKRETKPLRVSREKKKKKKERVSSTPENSTREQTSTEPESPDQTQTQPPTGTEEHESTKPVSPGNPMESEAGEPEGVQTSRAPRPDLRRAGPHVLGKIPIWWSDPACVRFSYTLFEALGLKSRWDPESRRGKDERGVFAAWLFAARAQTPMHAWQDLEDHAIRLAKDIAKYGKSAKSPGAVWRSKVQPQCKSTPARTDRPAAARVTA